MLSVGNPKSLCEFLNDVRDLGPFRHSTSALVSELSCLLLMVTRWQHTGFQSRKREGFKSRGKGLWKSFLQRR